MRTIIRLAGEAMVFLLWVATAVLMLRGKGGCGKDVRHTTDGIEYCLDGRTSDNGHLYSDRPVARWDIATAFDFAEM